MCEKKPERKELHGERHARHMHARHPGHEEGPDFAYVWFLHKLVQVVDFVDEVQEACLSGLCWKAAEAM